MSADLRILRSCLIRDQKILVDGEAVFARPDASFATFATEAFTALNPAYPKFYKMDGLSRLGLLAAEYLLAGQAATKACPPEEVGLVVANASSSTDTDLRYAALAQQNAASPALFVYTLPNIVVGEICIRHGFKGESAFFVMDSYDSELQSAYTTNLFQSRLVSYCLTGWLEFLGAQHKAFLCLVGPSPDQHLPLYNAAKVASLFNQ